MKLISFHGECILSTVTMRDAGILQYFDCTRDLDGDHNNGVMSFVLYSVSVIIGD